MFTRRKLLLGAITSMVALPALAHKAKTKKKFQLNPVYLPQMVKFSGHPPGTVVVDPKAHFLYLVYSRGRARRYGVGVGKAGLKFKGTARIGRKAEWPSWRPTDNMIRREPRKYARYAGGVAGGLKNPLGARALYLYRDNRDTMYRIHGTNQPCQSGVQCPMGVSA